MHITMTDNLTDPSNLSTLDDQSIEVLIQHYRKCLSNEESKHAESVAINKSVQHRLPDNLTVRERLLELEREQFNREKNNNE